MPRDFSPLAITLGLLASQALAACFAFALVIGTLFTYGNKAMVAFFEYGSMIALTLALGLLATGFGGYVSMLAPKKALINAVGVGVATLALNLGFMLLIDFKYGIGFRWMLVANALLTIPVAALGGYLFLRFDDSAPRRRG